MRNITLLLVLFSGLMSGYFLGEYRGREARRALAETIRTGKSLDGDLRATNASLKKDLDEVSKKYNQDLVALRKEYTANSAAWERTTNSLQDTVKRQNAKLSELNGVLGELVTKLGGSSGAEKKMLEQNIALLKVDIDDLVREINGNVCLGKTVPHSVLDTLNASRQLGSNQ